MDHQINTLLKVSLENIKEMIDVDTVIGEPIRANENTMIIPVSKVKMGYLAGGSEIGVKQKETPPFGGGTGGTVVITPVAFLVVSKDDVKVLHLEDNTHIADRVIDSIVQVIEKVKENKNKEEQ